MTAQGGPASVASWRPMLAARPVRNEAADVADDGEGLRIAVAIRRPWYLVPPISWIVPFKPERVVRLDRLGTQVWELCDGERTVELMCDVFCERHGLSFHEARVAVTGYLQELVRRGALAIALAGEDATE